MDGELNTFVHLWGYTDAADRERRRARLYADPRWLHYRHATGEQGWVLRQHNRLLGVVIPPSRKRLNLSSTTESSAP